jgi:hypothetical protein
MCLNSMRAMTALRISAISVGSSVSLDSTVFCSPGTGRKLPGLGRRSGLSAGSPSWMNRECLLQYPHPKRTSLISFLPAGPGTKNADILVHGDSSIP